jgi:hypothetical protein
MVKDHEATLNKMMKDLQEAESWYVIGQSPQRYRSCNG